MVRSVGVFPDIVIAVLIPSAYLLVKVRAPAVAHAKLVVIAVAGIVHMADGYGHQVAAKADISMHPHQIAGVVIHIARSRAACRSGRIVPVAFQAVVIPEVHSQGGHVGAVVRIVRGIELHHTCCLSILASGGDFKQHAGVFVRVPLPDNVCHIPVVISCVADHSKIFYGFVKVQRLCPGHRLRVPSGIDLMDLHRNGCAGVFRLVQFYVGAHNNIRGGNGRNLGVLDKEAIPSPVGAVAALDRRLCIPEGLVLTDRHVPHIGSLDIRGDVRIQNHRPRPVLCCQPLGRQDVLKGVGAAGALQRHFHIIVIFLRGIYQEGCGHNHDHFFPAAAVEPDAVIFLKDRYHVTHIQGIAVAPEGAVVPADNDRLLEGVGLQVVNNIGITIDIAVLQPGAKLAYYRLGMLRLGKNGGDVSPLHLGSSGIGLLHGEGIPRAHNRKAAVGQDTAHTELYGVAVLGDGDILVGGKLLREGHPQGTRLIGVDGAALGCGSNQGIVDLLPLSVFLIMDRLVVHCGQMQTVVHAKLFGVFCSLVRDFLHHFQLGSLQRGGCHGITGGNTQIFRGKHFCQCLVGQHIED